MNRVFITGATAGLGKALAERFATSGVTVCIHGRDPVGISELLRRSDVTFFRADLRSPAECERLAAFLVENSFDGLVSNAGVYTDGGTGIASEPCRELISVNLVAPLLIINRIYEHYKARRGGTIVSINSLAGLYPSYDEAVYCASKFGLSGYIRSIQADCHRHQIRVLEYYPGAIQTRMTAYRAGYNGLIKPADIAARIVDDVLSTHSFVPLRQELRKCSAPVSEGVC